VDFFSRNNVGTVLPILVRQQILSTTYLLANQYQCTYCSHSLAIQEAQLSLTNRAMLFCKVVEVLQDVLSENVDKKFTTQVPDYYSAFDTIILLRFYN